jgi:hypothetical protein
MRVRLRSSTWSLTLVPWDEARPDELGSSPLVQPTAARIRSLMLEQVGASASLRALLHELEPAAGVGLVGHDELAEVVALAIARGRIRVGFELPEPRVSSSPPRVELPEHSVEPTTPIDNEDHWIEVQVVGEDGEGLASVRCLLTLPDGREITRTTDRFGLIRVERLLAGECSIRFPDLDSEASV